MNARLFVLGSAVCPTEQTLSSTIVQNTQDYQQITEHTGLTDLQKKYWYDRRVDNASKYLRDKLTAPFTA